MPLQTHHEKKKEATSCQGRMGLLVSVLCTFFFFGANPSHHLPTEMGRYDCNYATGLPRKAQTHHRLIWQLFYSCQFLVTARARNESRS